MTITAYPLHWPTGRKRTEHSRRARAKFETSFAVARDEMIAEVRRLGGRNLIISTNIPLRQDGLPYATYKKIEDEGVAVYFSYDTHPMSFACDRWDRIEHNMQAIVKTIDALRGIARWGTGDMMKAAFTGFTALPSPESKRSWREVLGLYSGERNMEIVRAAYRRLASIAHPDKGGSHDAMTALNAALSDAEKELK